MKPNLLLCFCLGVVTCCTPVAAFRLTSLWNEEKPESMASSQNVPVLSVSLSSAEASSAPEREHAAGTILSFPEADTFTIYDQTTGELHTLSAQEYTLCAVAAEMPPTFTVQALQAQAVASYTYGLYLKDWNQKLPDASLKGGDFAADPSNWKGFVTREQYLQRYGEGTGGEYWERLRQAVEPVLGYVMVYEEQPVAAVFHSISGGITEDAANVWGGSLPYLTPVDSPGDIYAPGYETAEVFSPEALWESFCEAELVSGEPPETPSGWFTGLTRSPSGYVTQVKLAQTPLTGRQIRTVLGLRSTDFTVEWINGAFLFRVCGYGHGVGLSQYGAEYLGKQGTDWQDILQGYYTGVSLAQVEGVYGKGFPKVD